MAKRKAATLILLTVIFMMLFSTVSVFAQSSLGIRCNGTDVLH